MKRMLKRLAGPFLGYTVITIAFTLWIICEVFNRDVAEAAFAAVLFYSGSLSLALSPVGEWFFRTVNHCKKMPSEWKERIDPLFQEVLQKAKAEVSDLPEHIELLYTYSADVNAFTCGPKTVCVTEGLLEAELDDNEMAGILSHEIGHIAHGDFMLGLFRMFSNLIADLFGLLIFVVLSVIGSVIALILAVLGEAGGILWGIYLARKAVGGLRTLWIGFTDLFYLSGSRKIETEADLFVCSLDRDYAKGLYEFFLTYGDSQRKTSLLDSHPADRVRIETLRRAICEGSIRLKDKESVSASKPVLAGTWKGTALGLTFVLLGIASMQGRNFLYAEIRSYASEKASEQMSSGQLPSYFGHTYWICEGAASTTEAVDEYCRGVGGQLARANIPGEAAFISQCAQKRALYEDIFGTRHLFSPEGRKSDREVSDDDRSIVSETSVFVIEFSDGRKYPTDAEDSKIEMYGIPVYLGFAGRQLDGVSGGRNVTENASLHTMERKLNDHITVGFEGTASEYSDQTAVMYEEAYLDQYVTETLHTQMSGEEFLSASADLGADAGISYNSRLQMWISDSYAQLDDNYVIYWLWNQEDLPADSCHVLFTVRNRAEELHSMIQDNGSGTFPRESSDPAGAEGETSDPGAGAEGETSDPGAGAGTEISDPDAGAEEEMPGPDTGTGTNEGENAETNQDPDSGAYEIYRLGSDADEFHGEISNSGDLFYYDYYAPVTGVYHFVAGCDPGMAFYCELQDGMNNSIGGPGPFDSEDAFNAELEAGEEYQFVISPARGEGDYSIQITVPKEIQTIEENRYDGYLTFDGQKDTYLYTAQRSGEYRFTMTLDPDDYAVYNKVYRNDEMISPIGPYGSEQEFSVSLQEGETYQIEVSPAYGEGTYQINITEPE